jgi:arylsulfatase A-like enzyme
MAPIERGFQRWIAGTKHNAGFLDWERIDADARGFTEATEGRYATLVQLEEAELWWLAQPSPRFLMLCLNEAHGPFDRKPPDELLLGYPWPTAPGAERDRYLAKVRAADTALGRILALPGMDRALFVLVGDNGTPKTVTPPSQASHAKGTTFERGIRVPMVMRWPGVARGATHPHLVHLVDVPAACLALAGLPPEPLWDGRVLPPRRYVLAEIESLLTGSVDRCARGSRYKLRDVDGVEELYDLSADPAEQSPLDLGDPSLRRVLAALRVALR